MKRSFIAVLLVLSLGVFWLVGPVSRRGLESHPHPAQDYEEGARLVEAIRAACQAVAKKMSDEPDPSLAIIEAVEKLRGTDTK